MSADTFISLDCESNGLHGQVFAYAAALYEGDQEKEVWLGRCPIQTNPDPWVAANVLPGIEDMWESHRSYEELCEDWRQRYRDAGDRLRVVTHVPWPVEARFLADAHREPFTGPYPLIDVASMLLAKGYDPTSVDDYLRAKRINPPNGSPHHPLYDARAAALAYQHLLT